MKRFILNYFSISIPSVLLLLLPYLVKNFASLRTSLYYSNFKYAVLVLVLLIVQLIISFLYQNKKIFFKYLIYGLYSTLLIFFYGADIVQIINELQQLIFEKKNFRFRTFLFFFTMVLLSVQYILWFKSESAVGPQNMFFILLSFIAVPSLFTDFTNKDIRPLSKGRMKIDSVKDVDKSIFLIILDEYASPIELSRILQDNSINEFSYILKKKGWLVKDSFFSNETETIRSLSSLFNYNLSNDSTFSNLSEELLIEQCFIKSMLADDLNSKGVSIINNGIFPFGKTPPLDRAYSVPVGFVEKFLSNSIFPMVYSNVWNLRFSVFGKDFFPFTKHNINVFTSINLNRSSNKEFIYAHLVMPHSPFTYNSEFEFREISTKNYSEFWKFTNRKITPILDELSLNKGYKVILTGDHGYRSDSKLNWKLTFAAFYGFDTSSIVQIHSVQDLGSLINAQFQN